jgi:glycosyltransferase involved in cell wall biosynthesis
MEGVRARGVEVALACREDSVIREKAQEMGFKVYTLPFRGNLDISTLISIRNLVKRDKFNIVNTHSGKDSWVGGFGAKLAGAKFVRTRHLSTPINPSKLNFINEVADFIITTGESIKESMIKNNRIDPNKIESIPTGVDEEIFNPKRYNRELTREEFNISKDEIAVGIVAILRGFKRHDIFLEVAKEIIERNRDKKFKFIIAGDGPKLKSIKADIKRLSLESSVVMLGHIDNVAKLLSSLDIFLLTSDSKEGVPQSVIQALMMDLDVIATDVGSVRDLYKDNNFILTKPTVKSISKSLDDLINSRVKINHNREFIVKNFSKSAMVDRVIDIYKRLLS